MASNDPQTNILADEEIPVAFWQRNRNQPITTDQAESSKNETSDQVQSEKSLITPENDGGFLEMSSTIISLQCETLQRALESLIAVDQQGIANNLYQQHRVISKMAQSLITVLRSSADQDKTHQTIIVHLEK